MSDRNSETHAERLRKADERFYRETGKTPKEEARDSAQMLAGALVLVIVFGVAGVGYLAVWLWGLIGN